MDIRAIPGLAALLLPMSLGGRVDSEAVNLDGPAADAQAWSWRKIAARKPGAKWHASIEEDDDERHPYAVLTRWEYMLREDYGHETPPIGCTTTPGTTPERCGQEHGTGCWDDRSKRASIRDAAAYLDRMLTRVANDAEQDFPLLAREVRKVRRHLESVIRNSHDPERGARCPDCAKNKPDALPPKLVREYGHWCDEDRCERVHYHDDSGDFWVCPRDRTHWRTTAEYEAYLTERAG